MKNPEDKPACADAVMFKDPEEFDICKACMAPCCYTRGVAGAGKVGHGYI